MSSSDTKDTTTAAGAAAGEETQKEEHPQKARATYDAGCHCGYIKFSLTLSPPLPEYKVLDCNCSICRRNGYLLICKPSKLPFSSQNPARSANV